MKTLKKDLLTVNVYKTRDEMGKSAANDSLSVRGAQDWGSKVGYVRYK